HVSNRVGTGQLSRLHPGAHRLQQVGADRDPVRRRRALGRQAPDDRPTAHGLRALRLHRGGLQLLRPARRAPGRVGLGLGEVRPGGARRRHVPGRDAAGCVLPRYEQEVPHRHPHGGLRRGADGQAHLRRTQGHGCGSVERDRGVRRPGMEANSATMQVHGLRKSYENLHVLKGVDFDVARGSIFALLGSNGAGKTTIVRILTTLLKPDGGTASVDGFDVVSQPERVRESISLTGQFAAVDEILTGRENLIMMARLRHVKSAGMVADDLLGRFGLADAAGRRVSTYSGGMRRRLDIAMSLIGNPRIIFISEPTTGLDPEGRIEVWKVIQDLADGGTTVFLTTQYLDEAEKLADRIAILHEGTIIVSGTLEELRKLLPPAQVEYVERQPTLEE